MKRFVMTIIIILVVSSITVISYSDQVLNSYTYSYWGKPVTSPDGYDYVKTYDGKNLGIGKLSEPADIFSNKVDEIYITDTGNNRIVVIDQDFNVKTVLDSFKYNDSEYQLNSPQGVFVDSNETVYIADTGNKCVVVCEIDGTIERLLTEPDDEIEFSGIDFLPSKVLADENGYVYVLCKGIYQGALIYDPSGDFTGYFGTNRIEMTPARLMDYYWKKLLTREQRSKVQRFVPEEYCNFDIDGKGFIYTVTEITSNSLNQIKKINTLGVNVLVSNTRIQPQYQGRYGDLELKWYEGRTLKSRLVDVVVDSEDFVTAVDQERGRIFQYDSESNLMFAFGGTGKQTGTFRTAEAITVTGENLYVLDSSRGSITSFELSDYGRLIRAASSLYKKGNYIESKDMWLKVIELNGNCELAYAGLSKVFYEEGDNRAAMKYARLGYDRAGYAKALKKFREESLKRIIPAIITITIVLAVLAFIIKSLRSQITMIREYRG